MNNVNKRTDELNILIDSIKKCKYTITNEMLNDLIKLVEYIEILEEENEDLRWSL